MDGSCEICKNDSCLIKKNLSNSIVANVAQHKKVMRVQKNRQFIIEGTLVQGLFFVFDGVTKISKTNFNGKEQILRFSKQGETIGYRGFGNSKEYQIDAFSVTDATLCFFSSDRLEDLFTNVPLMTYDFMRFYAEELSNSETKVQKIAQMTVREKVIDSLLYIYRKFGQTNDFLKLNLSRKDIAGYAGTNEEQVIRVLSSLEKEGVISKKGKKIGLLKLQDLKAEIEEHNYYLSS